MKAKGLARMEPCETILGFGIHTKGDQCAHYGKVSYYGRRLTLFFLTHSIKSRVTKQVGQKKRDPNRISLQKGGTVVLLASNGADNRKWLVLEINGIDQTENPKNQNPQ